MFSATSLLTTLLLAISIASNPAAATPIVQVRSPHISLPFVRSLNFSGNLADHDRQRAQQLISAAQNHSSGNSTVKRAVISSVAVTNVGVAYNANVGVGSPPTNYTLLIDTDSSVTWVGAGKRYVKTSTSHNTYHHFNIIYGGGAASGQEYTDIVTLDSQLVITGQGIGVASESFGYKGIDGVLGLGPVDLTEGAVVGVLTIPTVLDNLKTQGTIASEVLGLSYEPTTTQTDTNGELTFGGVDSTKYTGSITYTTITTTYPASYYWGIDESITYGTSTTILSTMAGIINTGTTFILIPTDAYETYERATKATLDETTGLLKISSSNYNNLQSLFFTIGGTAFEFTKNAQTWPRSLNTYIGGTAGSIYLVVSDLGTPSGQGIDFVMGYTFLERFYSVYDTTNNRFGLATTPFTYATTN